MMGHKQECLMVTNLHVIRLSIKTMVAVIFSIIAVEMSAECTQDECLPDQLLNVFIDH
jgi:hypothetical protein